MKKNLFWMAVIGLTVMMSTMFTSCSKDDDEGMASELVGDWKSVGYYNNSINGNYGKREYYVSSTEVSHNLV
jgi:hypothetical protein